MGKFLGTWAGGRIRKGRDGSARYVIERMRDGDRRPITLAATSLQDALAELALFERDPAGYRAKLEAAQRTKRRTERVGLDEDLVEKFLGHLRGEDGGDARSELYIVNVATSLDWWDTKLRGADFRKVALAELMDHLDGAAGRKHRIIHLKSFCAFLRSRGLLRTAQDPTLELRVPQARPEKARRKKGHSMRELEGVYRAAAEQVLRDVICSRVKTSFHHTELKRLVAGEGELRELRDHGAIAGTAMVPHKNGRRHVVSCDAQTFAALKRLVARRKLPSESHLAKLAAAAAARARVPGFELGALRHTFATLARTHGVEVKPAAGGLPLATVAAAMGHLNPRTTAMFYDGTEVPPMVSLPTLHLVHPDDPAQLEPGAVRGAR